MKYIVVEKFTLRSDIAIEQQQVPLYDIEAVAGLRELFLSDQNISVDEFTLPGIPRCDGAIHVTGDSMYPLLMKGDIVLYKIVSNRREGLFFGEIYLLYLIVDGDEFVTIKRVYRSEMPGYYKLVSHNPEYPPKEVLIDHVRAMALVKASMRCSY